jgi:hypothetical protein
MHLSGYITFWGVPQGTYDFMEKNNDGYGNGSESVFASEYLMTSSACLGLQDYITGGSNPEQ